jgi:hypothetical protein
MAEAEVQSASPEPAEPEPVLDADGRERPRFLLTFPRDPSLDVLVRAFERGDFAYVRAHAAGVIAGATDPAVKDAASELRRRIDPDPTVVLLLGLFGGLLLFLVVWVYVGH